MKRFSLIALVLALFTLPAFAATDSIILGKPATVAGSKLPAGEYKVTLTGTGSNVQVVMVQKAKNPATVTFNANFTATKSDYTTVTVDNRDGQDTVKEIQLHAGAIVPANGTASGN